MRYRCTARLRNDTKKPHPLDLSSCWQLVFQPNFGVIRLAKVGDNLILSHVIVSQDAPESLTGTENTVHEISLAASMEPPPNMEFR